VTRSAGPDSAGATRTARGAGRTKRFPRPVRPLVPLVSSATVLLAWGLVAHNSGAGWVQAVGDVLAGALAVGLVGPAVVVARARVRVVDAPADATARLPVDVAVIASTRLRVDAVDPHGPQAFVGPSGQNGGADTTTAPPPRRRQRDLPVASPGHGTARQDDRDVVVLVPTHRGAYPTLTIDVATAAPFGLLWWTRRVVVRLPRELVVAPRLGRPTELPRRRDDTRGEAAARAPVPVGEPRGVRPYRAGDQRRWVHWPASAHTGELMVREMEGPTADALTVAVHLPDDVEAAERVAERALATVVALLDRGSTVVLATAEVSGTKLDAVADRRIAGRRLARAVAEPPSLGPLIEAAPGTDTVGMPLRAVPYEQTTVTS